MIDKLFSLLWDKMTFKNTAIVIYILGTGFFAGAFTAKIMNRKNKS